jgi:hypothetical protein
MSHTQIAKVQEVAIKDEGRFSTKFRATQIKVIKVGQRQRGVNGPLPTVKE